MSDTDWMEYTAICQVCGSECEHEEECDCFKIINGQRMCLKCELEANGQQRLMLADIRAGIES